MGEETKILSQSSSAEKVKQKSINDEDVWNEKVILIAIALIALCMFSFVLFYVWKYVQSNRRKKRQLEALTPKSSAAARLYSGIRVTQPIEFVVPTITLKHDPSFSSVTEESDSDYLVGGYHSDRDYNRNKKRSSIYDISAEEISKEIYDEFVTSMHKSKDPEISFVLHYSFLRQQLIVTVLSAKNLPMKKNHHLNPFAKIALLPDKTPKFVTKIQKHTSNPAFNELFIFSAIKESLDDRALEISVYNSDSFSRKSLIGRTLYPLKHAGIESSVDGDVITEDINCVLSNDRPSGEILVSLTYKPEISTLTLSVLKARNISMNDIHTIYIKVVLYLKKKRIRSRKSPVRRIQNEIEFNDIFHVHVATEALNDITIGIAAYGKSSSLATKQLIGKIYCGDECSLEQGRQHWTDMLNNYNSSVNQWYIFS